jgi:DNA invertase Pin-like site-specific DNA recombinase
MLVVWKLDRLGRNTKHLIEIVEELTQRKVGLKTLTGYAIDTSTPHGKLALHMFAALAEYERALIQERVLAGIAAARARGRKGGRKPKLSPAQQQMAAAMARGGIPITAIAQTLQCSRHTVYKALGQARVGDTVAPKEEARETPLALPLKHWPREQEPRASPQSRVRHAISHRPAGD